MFNSIQTIVQLSRIVEGEMEAARLPPWLYKSVQHSQILLAIAYAQQKDRPLHLQQAYKLLQDNLGVVSEKAAKRYIRQLLGKGYIVATTSNRSRAAKALTIADWLQPVLEQALYRTLIKYKACLDSIVVLALPSDIEEKEPEDA